MSRNSGLFRPEVANARVARLQGSVSIVTPMSWQIVGVLLIVALVVTGIFLASATYARIETVPGTVTLDRGVATVFPSRAGSVARIFVGDGERVAADQALFLVRSEEDMAGGSTAPEMVKRALRDQDARLANQGELVASAARADAARLAAQVAGAMQEIASIDAQMQDQQRLVAAAEKEFAEVEVVARKGFISRRDMEAREATVISRRQQLAQLRQAKAAKSAEADEARRAIAQARASAQAQVASTEGQRASLLERLATSEQSVGYVIRAPFAGTVTAMTARIGQRASADQSLALIVPGDARSTVELYVPTSAVGFVSRGQRVRLAIDAFPYQQFGTVETSVDKVSKAAIPRQIAGVAMPVYLVTGRLRDPTVRAFGKYQPILPGMTLTARITTERRSLLEWLFEPLFAVRNR